MKRVLFLFLFTLSVATVSAQLSLGIKAGANFADLTTPDVFAAADQDISAITTHWHAGISTKQAISDRFHVGAELLYSVKGFQESDDFNVIGDPLATLSLHYLSLPLMFYYAPNEKISLGAGVNLGYLMDAQIKVEDEKNDAGFIYDQEFDLGLNLGFQFNVTPALFLDARYQWGLTSVADLVFTDENGAPLGDGSLKNRVLQVSLGYFIIR